jgi:hypothetical protein
VRIFSITCFEDGLDDLQFPGAAVRTVVHVDVKSPLEPLCPTEAMRPDLDRLDLDLGSRYGCGGRLLWIRWPRRSHPRPKLHVRGQYAVEPDEMQSRPWHQRLAADNYLER